ncbi:MAG: hypothetical protein IPH88_19205 [Bacteroidales bacterium]|nr:hypothetical protein [Bacteroidales bacterium]
MVKIAESMIERRQSAQVLGILSSSVAGSFVWLYSSLRHPEQVFGSIGIISLVTGCTIIANSSMCTFQHINNCCG